jgi:serine/threonine protein kinase/ribosomal protein L40E
VIVCLLDDQRPGDFMICPQCGAENEDQAFFCRQCGTSLKDQKENDSPRPEEPVRDASPETTFQIGARVAGRYHLLRALGEGGMGVVFLATDEQLHDKEVALKVLHPQIIQEPDALRRFTEEVVISQDLNHPHIVKVFDLKRAGDRRFFTMEYVPGISLRQEMDRRKQIGQVFSLAETTTVVGQILEALGHAHTRTVHRDIKPENVMLVGDFPEVTVKVMDFGIAKTLDPSRLSTTARSLGTAYYMAPEQLGGGSQVTPASDLYAVGVIFYEMLTGQIPMGMARPPSMLIDGLPPQVDDVCRRALEFDAVSRYVDADQFLADLRNLPGAQVPAGPRDATEDVLPPEPAPASPGITEDDARRQRVADFVSWGQVAQKYDQDRRAAEWFEQALAEDPDNEAARIGLEQVRGKAGPSETPFPGSSSTGLRVGMWIGVVLLAVAVIAAGTVGGVWLVQKLLDSTGTGLMTGGDDRRATAPRGPAPAGAPARAPARTRPAGMTRDKAGRLILEAARQGDGVWVRRVVSWYPDLVRARDGSNYTPLIWAARRGRLALVRWLLDHKADPNARNRWDNTALHWAAAGGHTAVVLLLCKRGAELNGRESLKGNTPLHDAADEGRYEAVRALLRAGASIERRNKAGLTPAQVARKQGHHRVADLIRNHRPQGR